MPIPIEGSKVCKKCRNPKPVTDFYVHSCKRYRMAVCKACTILSSNTRSRRLDVRTKDNAAKRVANARLKEAAFAAYGGYKCACCNEAERVFLTIDHVHNDGAEWRKKHLGSRFAAGVQTYRWLAKNGFPPGFQVLCMNCQWGKKMNAGICPHRVTSNDYPEMGVGPSGPKRSTSQVDEDIVSSPMETRSRFNFLN